MGASAVVVAMSVVAAESTTQYDEQEQCDWTSTSLHVTYARGSAMRGDANRKGVSAGTGERHTANASGRTLLRQSALPSIILGE